MVVVKLDCQPTGCRISDQKLYQRSRLRKLCSPYRRNFMTKCQMQNGFPKENDKFVVTTPLYYVNAAPHIGGAYPTIAADVISRFNRLLGKQVKFITGTDEHGEKIAMAAQKNGRTPQEHCDYIVDQYKILWDKLSINYDSFIRTTDPSHQKLVLQVLERVWEKGDIYEAEYQGWYCVDCEEYKDEKEMTEDKRCPVHLAACQQRNESNYFFRLSKYQKELEDLLEADNGFLLPQQRKNEVMAWLKEGARDFSISRAAVEWGIPIPKDPKQTVYVWFDALIGYLSGLAVMENENGSESGLGQLGSLGWPASLHIIGKDILRFHAVYWPAMLMSADLPVPAAVFGHGFLTKDGLKMGKSLGNTLDPVALVDIFGADAVRFYFMTEIVFGSDGDFSQERFKDKVNARLANDIGNLLNRSLKLLKNNCDSKFPISANDVNPDNEIRLAVPLAVEGTYKAYEQLCFHDAAEAISKISGTGNSLMEQKQPWTTFKKGSEQEKKEAAALLVSIAEGLRICAILLSPIAPNMCAKIFKQLGYTEQQYLSTTWNDAQWGGILAGQEFPSPKPVFQRLSEEQSLKDEKVAVSK